MRLLSKKALKSCSFPFYTLSLKLRSLSRLSLSRCSLATFSTTATTFQEKPYESFFRHDSGRWLYNEDLRLAESYQEFDVRALKRVAARAVNQNELDVVSIVKAYEDDFSRTFAVTLREQTRVIARVPHPGTAHKRYVTASEVATMDFVRNHQVPTPKVLAYDVSADNEVGTQYIIMEEAPGQNVGKRWDSMHEDARVTAVVPVAGMEWYLMALGLPASGSIYYKRDLEPGVVTVEIPPDLGKRFGDAIGEGFCIGPVAHNDWWGGGRAELSDISRGPWLSSEDFIRSVAERELAWMQQYARPRYPNPVYIRRFFRYEQVSPEEHIKNLKDFLQIVGNLTPQQISKVNDRPVILQHDLQLRNLFVNSTIPQTNKSDPSMDLLSVTNWGQASVLPLFMQAGIPSAFSSRSEDYCRITRMLNLAGTHALQDLFSPAGDLARLLCKAAASPWQGDSVTLRALLIRAVQEWPTLTGATAVTVQVTEMLKTGVEDGEVPKTTLDTIEKLLNPEIPACPLAYSPEEIERSDYFSDKLSKVAEQFEWLRRGMQLDRNGFVGHERFKSVKGISEFTKKRLIEIAEDKHVEKYEYGVMWPFDDHDESGQFCPLRFDDDGELQVMVEEELDEDEEDEEEEEEEEEKSNEEK